MLQVLADVSPAAPSPVYTPAPRETAAELLGTPALAPEERQPTVLGKVCSWCKRVQVGEEWLDLPVPPGERSSALCPDCAPAVEAEGKAVADAYRLATGEYLLEAV